METKYSRTLRRVALDGALDAETAETLINAHIEDAGKWEEGKHPRAKNGRFTSGGRGSGGGGSKGSSEKAVTAAAPTTKTPATKADPSANASHKGKPGAIGGQNGGQKLIPRKAEKGSGIAGMVRAARITRAGEASMASKCAEMDSGSRFAAKPGEMREGPKFAEGSAFNKPKVGKASESLPKGSGATKLSVNDLYSEKKPNAKHTINQYLDDNGNLTAERESLHAQSVENLFAGKKPKGPGEKKTFTMFGGGSAAGKGGLSDPKRCGGFKSEFYTNGTPSKDTTVTIDADEIKKDIPEYRQMQETDPDNAAATAHEESSAIAKRAMQAAFENGYDCTLDGTGDGNNPENVRKKINQARAYGYEVNACYVTCPTEMAVQRSMERAKKTKRNVPLDAVRGIHESVSAIFPQVAKDFDHCALFDTSQGGKPVLVAECVRNGKIQIRNQKLWDAFLAKAPQKPQSNNK